MTAKYLRNLKYYENISADKLKQFIIDKFGNRFDLSEFDNEFYGNNKKRVYKIIDTWTDNVYFKTPLQIKLFSTPLSFKKQDLLDEIIAIFGVDRFDFSKSIIKKRLSVIEIYDNYQQKTLHMQINSIKKMPIISKPDRENMLVLLRELNHICKCYDIENMEYITHDHPIKIQNFKTKNYIKLSLKTLCKMEEVKKRPKKLHNKKNFHTNDEIYNKLVNLYPNYLFDINDLFAYITDGKSKKKTVKYTDMTNNETYSHQILTNMICKYMPRTNQTAKSEQNVIDHLKKEYPLIDCNSIIFPNSTFKYKTNFYLIQSSKIKYKLINGVTQYETRLQSFFRKDFKYDSNKITQDSVIQKFKKLDIYNNFDFSELVYIDGVDTVSGRNPKVFKIYNKVTKKMLHTTYIYFKDVICKKENFRENNKKNYIYLNKSDTTKKGHVDIICPSHGNFSQWSKNHFVRGDCCPLCNASTGETKIYQYFNANEIKFDFKYKAHKLMKLDYLRFDFYLPEFDIYIQYNGEHHHKTVQWANSLTPQDLDDNLRQEQLHDEMKFEYCKKNNLNYIVLNYWQLDNLEVALEEELYKLIESRKI